jgi:hypothetical protein
MKKLLALLLALSLVLALAGCNDDTVDFEPERRNRETPDDSAPAPTSQPPQIPDIPVNPAEDFEYGIYEKYVFIENYIGTTQEVHIPSEIEGLPVMVIGTRAFENNAFITAVIIPYGVDAIGKEAFSGCIALASVHIPESVEMIQEGAFANTGLTSVYIPDSVIYFGRMEMMVLGRPSTWHEMEFVFTGSTALTSITFRGAEYSSLEELMAVMRFNDEFEFINSIDLNDYYWGIVPLYITEERLNFFVNRLENERDRERTLASYEESVIPGFMAFQEPFRNQPATTSRLNEIFEEAGYTEEDLIADMTAALEAFSQ